MASPNPYATLQLRPPYRKATLDQIKQQRKKLELKYHPDKQGSEASEEFLAQCAERLAAVRAAFALIGTETARAEYDAASAAHSSTSATTKDEEQTPEARRSAAPSSRTPPLKQIRRQASWHPRKFAISSARSDTDIPLLLNGT